MSSSQWHKFYTAQVAAPPGVLFELLADMPEPEGAGTRVSRWLVLDISMPGIFRPLRRLILNSFDKENLRTMSAVKKYAEAHSGDSPGLGDGRDADRLDLARGKVRHQQPLAAG